MELPLSATGTLACAVVGAADGTVAADGAGDEDVGAPCAGYRTSSGAGLSGSSWPASWISIHRTTSPSPYVSRVLKESLV